MSTDCFGVIVESGEIDTGTPTLHQLPVALHQLSSSFANIAQRQQLALKV